MRRAYDIFRVTRKRDESVARVEIEMRSGQRYIVHINTDDQGLRELALRAVKNKGKFAQAGALSARAIPALAGGEG